MQKCEHPKNIQIYAQAETKQCNFGRLRLRRRRHGFVEAKNDVTQPVLSRSNMTQPPLQREKHTHCKNHQRIEDAFQLARITHDAGTSLQSQPSSYCCSPSLMRESANAGDRPSTLREHSKNTSKICTWTWGVPREDIPSLPQASQTMLARP